MPGIGSDTFFAARLCQPSRDEVVSGHGRWGIFHKLLGAGSNGYAVVLEDRCRRGGFDRRSVCLEWTFPVPRGAPGR